MAITLRTVFEQLGFKEQWDAISDQLPGYFFHHGALSLTATQVTNQYLRPVFYIGGQYTSRRTMAEIGFEMPLEVESFDQGVAWLAYGVGPNLNEAIGIPWIQLGRELKETLPWVRQAAAYAARPQCLVERDWFRLASRKLRDRASISGPAERAVFSFDGDTLRVVLKDAVLSMPASGAAWVECYAVIGTELASLPQRITTPLVPISVWDGRLHIGKRVWAVAQSREEDARKEDQ